MANHREHLKRYLREGPRPAILQFNENEPDSEYQAWLWENAATVNKELGMERTLLIAGFDPELMG